MVNLHCWLGRVKEDLANLLDDSSVFSICRSEGYRWRMGPLNPAVLIRLFVLQILHSNTACGHLRHLSGLSFTASAYCQTRMRLPLKVIIMLVRRVAQTLTVVCDHQSLWLGHRVWRIDGSVVSMPDTAPLQNRFGQPSVQPTGCGYPVASILVRMHAGTGMWLDLLVGALVDQDMMHMPRVHERLRANDVIVADRGFCSFRSFSPCFTGQDARGVSIAPAGKVGFHRRASLRVGPATGSTSPPPQFPLGASAGP